ncbi:MAG: rhomboid family intramembrane serine protease [Nonomuraea sp.]|nr:rhomboid family intramembrane serine protease [Nonomuraea sp.]
MKRVPLATAVLVVVTAVPSLLQFVIPGLEPALMRDPAAISQGQWWRLVTALVVQDGGLFGTLTNLVFLAVLGFLAERALGAGHMLLLYGTGAVVGEATGYLLDAPGAGNSITVCALAGGLAVASWLGRADRMAGAVAAFYLAVIGIGQLTGSTIATVVVAVAATQLVVHRDRVPAWVPAAIAAVAGLALVIRTDMHGPPVLAGMLVGWLLTAASRSTSTPTTPA